MRHRKHGRRLNMKTAHRKAMFRNMVSSLFQHRRIETTDAKAKELRAVAEKLITFAKRGDLHARRQVLRSIPDQKVVHELFETIAPAMAERSGGYTRVIKSRRRPGDNAALSLVELVGLEPKIEEMEEKLETKRQKRESKETAMQQQMAAQQAQSAKDEK